ncbi:MAG: hypothetical protein HON94_12395 [Methylococcales bacterium]|jgi:recombinational DNA repair protein (RecF pathway)|nr:hypothetical protein [Methylococcales bacterium]MBT7409669.1 hypothetical protein [Methylococcales bacterium]
MINSSTENCYYTKQNCDRCGNQLTVRKVSWFTDDILCIVCVKKEQVMREELDPDEEQKLKGCGYLPD